MSKKIETVDEAISEYRETKELLELARRGGDQGQIGVIIDMLDVVNEIAMPLLIAEVERLRGESDKQGEKALKDSKDFIEEMKNQD